MNIVVPLSGLARKMIEPFLIDDYNLPRDELRSSSLGKG